MRPRTNLGQLNWGMNAVSSMEAEKIWGEDTILWNSNAGGRRMPVVGCHGWMEQVRCMKSAFVQVLVEVVETEVYSIIQGAAVSGG